MKNLALKVIATAALVVFIGAIQHTARADSDADDRFAGMEGLRIQRGLDIAPVHLNMDYKNRELVGLGSYLVNAIGGCNDCHTQPLYVPGGDPFKGEPKKVNVAHYLGGGRAFGPFISRNLTPENGLPAGHTYDEFKTIMRTGVDFDHAHPQFGPLLQVMPWPSYQDMTDHEIRAIYEYLRAIPPATRGK
jgi:hypothetical protein